MSFEVDPGWVFAVVLSMTRVAGFVVGSPIYSRAIPAVGRVAFVAVLGVFFAEPIAGGADLLQLAVWTVVNFLVGWILGFITGLIFTLFTMAGSLLDFTSGLAVAQVFDPTSGSRAAPFGRSFNIIALALFFVIGGHRLVIRGLGLSFATVGITGSLTISGEGTGEVLLELFTRTFVAALELAMPALAALFLVELVMGLASRFAPQANVFLLGLPLKLMAALASVTVVVLLMPDAMSGVTDVMRDTFGYLVNALS